MINNFKLKMDQLQSNTAFVGEDVENLDPMFYENTKKLNPEIQNDNDIVIVEYC